eukprot:TRINITY_DN1101_c0_g1_i3.p1 TRINITY_DN1101_c0_g1~~TRINITY_DN1101_c0_g1_i3.p1  ORF type:complete len:765 (-),score=135.00 TRINITY_DN1101_c0_g1_i3:1254-3503(-)
MDLRSQASTRNKQIIDKSQRKKDEKNITETATWIGRSRAVSAASSFSGLSFLKDRNINKPTNSTGVVNRLSQTTDHVSTIEQNEKPSFNFISDSRDPTSIYKLNTIIGKGGFGTIWNAVPVQPVAKKFYAVKVVPFERGEEGLTSKLKEEIQLLQACRVCPWVVRFHGSFIDVKTETNGKDLWIVMDYCDCQSLLSYMRKMRAPFTESEIAIVFSQVLKGLSFLHKLKIVHCDIKAENILWDSEGITRIADFGEAIQLNDENSFGKEMRGTPHFMAPELVLGDPYDTKADIWSFGIMAIELAECLPPHSKIHPMRAMQLISQQTDPPKLSCPSNFSASYLDLISKCLSFDPKNRPTCEQLLKHDFFKQHTVDTSILRNAAQKYLYACQTSALGAKRTNAKSKKQIIVDANTGETFERFTEKCLSWRDENSLLLNELATRTRSRTRSFAVKDVLSSSSGSPSSAPSPIGSLRRKSVTTLQHPPEAKKKLDRWIILLFLAARLSSPTFGVLVEDRVIKGATYQQCFVGKECVDWIYENLRLEARDKAVQLAINLMVSGLILPITSTDENMMDHEQQLYRFDNRKIREWGEDAFQDDLNGPVSDPLTCVTSTATVSTPSQKPRSLSPNSVSGSEVSFVCKRRSSVVLEKTPFQPYVSSIASPVSGLLNIPQVPLSPLFGTPLQVLPLPRLSVSSPGVSNTLSSFQTQSQSLNQSQTNTSSPTSSTSAQPTWDYLTERDWKLIETGSLKGRCM